MSTFPNTPTTMLTRIAAQVSGVADEALWQEFFGLYEPAMQRFLKAHGAKDPDDLVQTVFVKLVPILREGRYDRKRGSFRAFLATLLYNEMVSHLRHESARGAGVNTSLEENGDLPERNDPALKLDVEWKSTLHATAVQHVLNNTALSQQSKEVYEDLMQTGDTCAEVARRHDLPPATVRQISSRVSRMIAAIEKRFGDEK